MFLTRSPALAIPMLLPVTVTVRGLTGTDSAGKSFAIAKVLPHNATSAAAAVPAPQPTASRWFASFSHEGGRYFVTTHVTTRKVRTLTRPASHQRQLRRITPPRLLVPSNPMS